MYTTTCTAEHFATLVAFVARLNSNGAHHIGYFGTHPSDIASGVSAATPAPEQGFLLAYDAGQLVGVLGADCDTELGRAWLYGPMIEHPAWHSVADQLYSALLPALPAEVHEQELFCDRENRHCQAFAERHGFMLHGEAAILNFSRGQLDGVPAATGTPLAEHQAAAFSALHDALFPGTYASAATLLAERGPTSQILVIGAGSQVTGYFCGKVNLEAGEAYIDYLGVAAAARGQGLGRTLLAQGLRWMFSFPQIERTDLTVESDNAAALRLYAALGFHTERTMRAYRKRSQ